MIETFVRNIAQLFAPTRIPPPVHQDTSNMMRANVYHEHGAPDVLKYTEFPSPKPSTSSQVVVDIYAAGVNPVDLKLRKGPVAGFLFPKPKIPGSDMAGIVVHAPENSKFKEGDRVYAMLPLLGTSYGSYAERVCVNESILAKVPDNIDLIEAAAIPLVACTVIQAMRPIVESFKGNLKGKKCFIQAGSGGVGVFAIQYCSKCLEMDVATSCSTRNVELVKSLGAKVVVDYTKEKIEDKIKDYDVFLDSMGYMTEELVLNDNSHILKRSGPTPSHYIRIASSPLREDDPHRHALGVDHLGLAIPEARIDHIVSGYWKQFYTNYISSYKNIRYHFILVSPEKDALHEIYQALEEGKIRPVVQERIPMSEAARAHEIQATGRVVGKLLLVNQR